MCVLVSVCVCITLLPVKEQMKQSFRTCQGRRQKRVVRIKSNLLMIECNSYSNNIKPDSSPEMFFSADGGRTVGKWRYWKPNVFAASTRQAEPLHPTEWCHPLDSCRVLDFPTVWWPPM